MNTSLFHRYYEQQLESMDTNPTLRTQLADKLSRTKPSHRLRNWLVAATSATVLVGGMAGLIIYLQPKPVTADALLRQALATPTLQPGQIYQSSWNRTSMYESETTQDQQTSISDGRVLERLAYDESGILIGAELAIPQTVDRSVYDLYEYGSLRDFPNGADTNIVLHHEVNNIDLHDDVSSDDPSTFANSPDGFTDSFGRNSILELVAGSSMWRPYVTNDVKKMSFFVEPIVTEDILNGVAVYKLDERQPNIGFEAIAWISKEDGRILQESSSDYGTVTDITTYSTPMIKVGAVPQTVDELITALRLTNIKVTDETFEETADYTYFLPDDRDIPNCGGTLPDLDSGMCGLEPEPIQ